MATFRSAFLIVAPFLGLKKTIQKCCYQINLKQKQKIIDKKLKLFKCLKTL